MLDKKEIDVLTCPLPEEQIKQRPGKGGLTFKYISPDFVIKTLNHAFAHAWDTKIVYSEKHENTVVVGLELSVNGADGSIIKKQQFGSCEVSRGLGVGEAFKGAASDALKKCATLLGLGLELYQSDEPASAGPPPAARFSPPGRAPAAPPRPATPPAPLPSAPPRPAVSAPTPNVVKAPAPAPAPRSFPPKQPAVSPPPSAPRSAAPRPARAEVNPFESAKPKNDPPSSTQLNSMTNLANKRGVSHAELIALAGILDNFGQPVRTFEELGYSQAIQVIQAAQR